MTGSDHPTVVARRPVRPRRAVRSRAPRTTGTAGRPQGILFDLPELRDRLRVFQDRHDAGRVLATLLAGARLDGALVLGVPAGGIPVARAFADRLGLPLDVAVVGPIAPPWNARAAYGAVAFDGTMRLDDELVARLGLGGEQIRLDVQGAAAALRRRAGLFRDHRPYPDLTGRTVILVDEGLSAACAMVALVEAVRKYGAERVVVAVPTGVWPAARQVLARVEILLCPNMHTGLCPATSDAYERWHEVDDAGVRELVRPDAAAAVPPATPRRLVLLTE